MTKTSQQPEATETINPSHAVSFLEELAFCALAMRDAVAELDQAKQAVLEYRLNALASKKMNIGQATEAFAHVITEVRDAA